MEATADFIGKSLGNYEIKELIGSGGMAEVYLAFDRNLQREVAVKVLSDKTATQPDFIERFRHEAQTLARLTHPNIVTVYDLGEQDGYFYMVQELLAGPTLEERMNELKTRNEKMAREEILSTVSQLAGALDTAHAEGIIHRDVKPCNAMYNSAGALVLTDFGIAKSMLADAKLTQTGMVFGTPAYLSPEQAKGLELTPASDIYSLGVVLYELITGDAPFTDNTPMGVVLQHIQNDPPPLVPVRAGLPRTVEAVGKRALAKEPAERFSSASELARALEEAWPAEAAAASDAGAVAGVQNDATRMWNAPANAGVAGAAAAGAGAAGAVSNGAAAGEATPPTTAWQGDAAGAVATPQAGIASEAEQNPNRSLVLPSPLTHRFAPRMVMTVVGGLLLMLLLGRTAMVLNSSDDGPGANGVAAVPTFTLSPFEANKTSLFGDGSATPTLMPEETKSAVSPTADSSKSETTATPQPAPSTATAQPQPVKEQDSLEVLRQMVADGTASGKLRGEAAREISKKLDEMIKELTEGKREKAAEKLVDMVDKLFHGLEDGEVDPTYADQLAGQIQKVMQEYGLYPEEDDDEKKGKGKCKGKGKGKGKGRKKHCD